MDNKRVDEEIEEKRRLAAEFLLSMNKSISRFYAKKIDYNIDPKWDEFGLYE